MQEEVYDLQLQRKYQSALGKSPKHAALLKSQLYCGNSVIHAPGFDSGAFVLSNGQKAKFFGIASCDNSWSCPHCAVKQMSKYAAEIAVALDALKARGQLAFMLTLTIPHLRFMTCEQVTEILYNSWKVFVVRGNKNQHAGYYVKKDGQKVLKRSEAKSKDVFAAFCEEFNCKHRVRVGEYTWGKNGWHPHFHCLFWVDADKIEKVSAWQSKISKRWLEIVRRETLKILKRAKVDADDIARLEDYIDILYKKAKDKDKAAYISVDKQGKIIVQKSSMYICGWGADRELTGNFKRKATNEGHLTPFQLLEKATDDPNDEWMKLYLEYAWATRVKRHARINFSVHSGIKKIIEEWKKTHVYQEVCKKKAATNPNTGLKVVCWFKEFDWWNICLLNRQIPIKAQILEAALMENPLEAIKNLLMKYNIQPSNRANRDTHIVESLFVA